MIWNFDAGEMLTYTPCMPNQYKNQSGFFFNKYK